MRFVFLAWRDLAHPLAGGSEVLVDRLAAGLVERGHQVDLVCGGPGPRSPRPYPVTVCGGTYSQYLGAPLACLRDHRHADVVVDVVNGMPYFSPLWRRRPVLGLVNHVHTEHWGLWYPAPVAVVGRSIESRAFPAAYRRHRIVAVSPSTAAALVALGFDPAQLRIVHNGVDAPTRPAAESPEPLFLALGRLVPHKRFDVLVRLWEKVRPLTGGRLVIAGEGPEGDRLRAMAGPGVSVPGRVTEDEKQRLLAGAWMLLHPASVEGWGLVILEAAAAGTPTVGFDVAGVRDSIVAGETGVLVSSEEELVAAWTALALDPGARHRLGLAARRRAEGFSWSATVERFLEVAVETVGNQGRPQGAAPARSSPPRAVAPG